MRIFKNKVFNTWAKSVKLTDKAIKKSVDEMDKELFEANLGANIYKKRIAIANKGKRGGARTIVAYKTKHNTFFIYGFAKNKKANVTENELDALKDLAKLYLSYTDKGLDKAVKEKKLFEVKTDEKINS